MKNVTLRGLDFTVPAVPLKGGQGVTGQTAAGQGPPSTLCGILVGVARALTIEDCAFEIVAPSTRSFGGAILVVGATSQVTITGNSFIGVGRGELVGGVLAWVTAANASTELTGWNLSDNRFSGLAVAALGYGQLGLIDCSGNIVVNCAAGFIFAEANLGATGAFTKAALYNTDQTQNAPLGQAANVMLRPDILTRFVAGGDPILSAMTPPPASPTVSGQARKVLADQLNASGLEALKAMSAGVNAGTPPAQGAAPAQAAADTQKASVNTAAFDDLDKISLTGEIYEVELTPAVRIDDNEITLSAEVITPWIGIAVILSTDEPGSVIVNGNRVVVPDATTAACGVMFPAGLVLSGNLLAQQALAPDGGVDTPCLVVISRSPAIMVSANLASFTEAIYLPRSTAAATGSWDFLNTTA